jgi:Concanavalin A-like lectin/glucanases superfamily
MESSSGPQSITGTFTSNALGRYSDALGVNAPYQWQGKLDDVRIYNRALSADEVKRLYNMGR